MGEHYLLLFSTILTQKEVKVKDYKVVVLLF